MFSQKRKRALPRSVRSGRVTVTTSISVNTWRYIKDNNLKYSQLIERAVNKRQAEEQGLTPSIDKLQVAVEMYRTNQKGMQGQLFKLEDEIKALRRAAGQAV